MKNISKTNNKHKSDAIHRIKIIQGHVKKILDMLENDEYCVNIVHQSRAVQSAFKKFDNMVVAHHLSTCVIDRIKKGEKSKTVEELSKLFEYT